MDELIGEQTIIAQFTYESSPKNRIKQAVIVSEAEIIGYTYNFEE